MQEPKLDANIPSATEIRRPVRENHQLVVTYKVELSWQFPSASGRSPRIWPFVVLVGILHRRGRSHPDGIVPDFLTGEEHLRIVFVMDSAVAGYAKQ